MYLKRLSDPQSLPAQFSKASSKVSSKVSSKAYSKVSSTSSSSSKKAKDSLTYQGVVPNLDTFVCCYKGNDYGTHDSKKKAAKEYDGLARKNGSKVKLNYPRVGDRIQVFTNVSNTNSEQQWFAAEITGFTNPSRHRSGWQLNITYESGIHSNAPDTVDYASDWRYKPLPEDIPSKNIPLPSTSSLVTVSQNEQYDAPVHGHSVPPTNASSNAPTNTSGSNNQNGQQYHIEEYHSNEEREYFHINMC
jgi:hypothetical protein